MAKEKIILIDGSGYIFRAYYAIQRLSTSKGVPTNAVYGFVNMLLKVLEVERPTKLMIAFDTGQPTFRTEQYAEYKSNRDAPPEDLEPQFDMIFRAVDCFGIFRKDIPGYEADDILGTIAKRAEAEGYHVEIITGDKDLMQLVTPNITLYDTMKEKRIDPAGVVERFGVRPEQIVDLLALMGDSSDNIPGVTSIGEKTAAELIKTFGSLDELYKRIDEIKQPKRKEILLKEKDIAFLSRQLATIKCDMNFKFSWDEMTYTKPKEELLSPFLQEMEFTGLMQRFGYTVAEKPRPKKNYLCVADEDSLKTLTKALDKAEWIAVDTETTGLKIHESDLVGISLSVKKDEGFYIPVGHMDPDFAGQTAKGQLPAETVREALRPYLEGAKAKIVGQNLKFDSQVLRRWGLELKNIQGDTLLASYLVDPEGVHNLDGLAEKYLGHKMISYDEVTGVGKNQINFSEVAIDKATEYSAEDAEITYQLNGLLMPELEKAQLWSLYQEIEIPLLQVLARMEYEGVLVDAGRLKDIATELDKEMTVVDAKITELAGEKFNINSPKQMSKILFEKLQLPIVRKTKTGISTDESVLRTLASKHPICQEILRFRELAKLRSTYVEGLLGEIQKGTGRVHSNFNQTVAATGRLSSSDPNLQNIPAGVEERYDIRTAFIAPKGLHLLSADYSQVELRILAHLSEDENLLEAFAKDQDVHEHTARIIFNTATISSDQRRVAKTINFGVVYGQTPYGLSQTLGISTTEAKQFIDAYFARYKRVKGHMQSVIESAQKQGFVTTMLGRRRYIPEINSQNRMRREMSERAAINSPLQGTAADMIKIAMINLARTLEKEKLKTRMIMQVHDELVLEVPEAEKEIARELLRREMETALKLRVPIKVDMGWGKNWREC